MSKTQPKIWDVWRGPYIIVKERSPWVYKVEHLVSGKLITPHVARLRYYADSQMNVTTDHLNLIALEDQSNSRVEKFGELDYRNDAWHVDVRWLGFEPESNTRKPCSNMLADVPEMFEKYLSDHPQQDIVKLVRRF